MRFREQYWFLSNMSPSPIRIDIRDASGRTRTYTFSCVESAFQAHKAPDHAWRFAENGTVGNGFDAKRMGRKLPLRPDWEAVKVPVMERLVRAKFKQNPELMAKLKRIPGDIIEENTWGDTFWGCCDGRGENVLGQILMQIRDGQ